MDTELVAKVAERLGGPVWLYPCDRWTDTEYGYRDEAHGALHAHRR